MKRSFALLACLMSLSACQAPSTAPILPVGYTVPQPSQIITRAELSGPTAPMLRLGGTAVLPLAGQGTMGTFSGVLPFFADPTLSQVVMIGDWSQVQARLGKPLNQLYRSQAATAPTLQVAPGATLDSVQLDGANPGDAGWSVSLSGWGGGPAKLSTGAYELELRNTGSAPMAVFVQRMGGTLELSINVCKGGRLADAQLPGADLSNVTFFATDLTGANLRGANLIGTRFLASRLDGADLSGARLDGVELDTSTTLNVRGLNAVVAPGRPCIGGDLDACLPHAQPPADMVTRAYDEREDTTIYMAVVNHEEQYSIWPAHREVPLGWQDTGKHGLKAEVLAWIQEVWTDMRPLSLRKKMEEMERQRAQQR